MKLIVVNYSMSPSNLLFSHQVETVFALAKYFETVHVFTHETYSGPMPGNVKVSHLAWKNDSNTRNALTIFKVLLPVIVKNRRAILFSHMTEVPSALLSPFTWILRMRHILWYAHATNSRYLVWSSFFVSTIVSSTHGSCRLKFNRKKIKFINQGINPQNFAFQRSSITRLKRLFYYGRLDQSKNIIQMVELLKILNSKFDSFEIHVYGPQTPTPYLENVKALITSNALCDYIVFHPPILRRMIPEVAENYGTFLNLSTGSLDKTLIETTFLGIPVITWNKEYCSQFGSWSKQPVNQTLDFILSEIRSLSLLNSEELNSEVVKRLGIAFESHSFTSWVSRLAETLVVSQKK